VRALVVARAGRLDFLSTMRAMAVERINDLPLTATYLSPGEVFPRSSVDCTRQRQIPKPSISLGHGRHAHSSEIKPLAGS
jgi:hypothetical protein